MILLKKTKDKHLNVDLRDPFVSDSQRTLKTQNDPNYNIFVIKNSSRVSEGLTKKGIIYGLRPSSSSTPAQIYILFEASQSQKERRNTRYQVTSCRSYLGEK